MQAPAALPAAPPVTRMVPLPPLLPRPAFVTPMMLQRELAGLRAQCDAEHAQWSQFLRVLSSDYVVFPRQRCSSAPRLPDKATPPAQPARPRVLLADPRERGLRWALPCEGLAMPVWRLQQACCDAAYRRDATRANWNIFLDMLQADYVVVPRPTLRIDQGTPDLFRPPPAYSRLLARRADASEWLRRPAFRLSARHPGRSTRAPVSKVDTGLQSGGQQQ